ncbi:PLP-dependent aminotransferase family protein [Rhodococcus sp. H29-C3]|uniref:MocR-like pyridoxine biosynthesis transcription factor PdxR n=1 Tax=Rhodococcus sp. H29-C3 TaxID=3046307 RepID=UPI0024B93BE8|nr:PLP-dependent aminotransferase family protein [Rhodococcus sp. H29-C3]MDJ0359592.1 PLP-dependent aminotransferase family protein [Rhodococcus sp. H29-C3]
MVENLVNRHPSAVDLHLDLAPDGSRKAALSEALREAVTSGRLESGFKLPSYRALAEDLAIARNTVADTYAELVSEGWLEARQGSGTRVAHRPGLPHEEVRAVVRAEIRPQFEFRSGRPDPTTFPRSRWLASARRAVTAAPTHAFGPGDPHGRIELRRALADYLSRTRGLVTDPRKIVVCAGFSHAAEIIADVVAAPPFAVESYGLPFHRAIYAKHGPTIALPVDRNGCVTDELTTTDAQVAVLTSSHQFPTGSSLLPRRRTAAIDWARTTDGLVVEDDYDGEFRFDRTPVGAMQSLDPDRVMYVGSVSKSLSPALRLGWMVVPERLLDPVLEAKGVRESTVGVIDQLTLADLITTGGYDRHVRAMRTRYRRRRAHLIHALGERVPHAATMGIAAGLQVVVTLPPGTESAVLRAAGDVGVAVDGLSRFRHPEATGKKVDGILVGYSAPAEHTFPAAVDALLNVLVSVGRAR